MKYGILAAMLSLGVGTGYQVTATIGTGTSSANLVNAQAQEKSAKLVQSQSWNHFPKEQR